MFYPQNRCRFCTGSFGIVLTSILTPGHVRSISELGIPKKPKWRPPRGCWWPDHSRIRPQSTIATINGTGFIEIIFSGLEWVEFDCLNCSEYSEYCQNVRSSQNENYRGDWADFDIQSLFVTDMTRKKPRECLEVSIPKDPWTNASERMWLHSLWARGSAIISANRPK